LKKAVLTGSVIGADLMSDKKTFLAIIKNIFDEIERNIVGEKIFEIIQGNSFQAVFDQPEDAIIAGITIRAGLRSKTMVPSLPSLHKQYMVPTDKLWDAKISIGVGPVEYVTSNPNESFGDAFDFSREGLEKLKPLKYKMCIKSESYNLNETFIVLNKLADAIINRWTNLSSEIVYRYLMYNETQQKMAAVLGISQPAVHKRLALANIDAIKAYIEFCQKLILNRNN